MRWPRAWQKRAGKSEPNYPPHQVALVTGLPQRLTGMGWTTSLLEHALRTT